MKAMKLQLKPKLHTHCKEQGVSLSEYIRGVIKKDKRKKHLYKDDLFGYINTSVYISDEDKEHLRITGMGYDKSPGQYLNFILNREMIG